MLLSFRRRRNLKFNPKKKACRDDKPLYNFYIQEVLLTTFDVSCSTTSYVLNFSSLNDKYRDENF
jgi:hypothetical protein